MDLLSKIQIGSHCAIRHFALELPCTCLIVDISHNVLDVLVKIPSEIAEGDPVVLTFTNNSTTFILGCTVDMISQCKLKLIVDDIITHQNNRKHERYFTSYAGLITYDNSTKFATIKDLSEEGCLLVTEFDGLKKDDEVAITIKPDQLVTIDLKAVVVRCNKINDYVWEIGLIITHLDTSNISKFNKLFVDLIKLEEDELSSLKILKLKGEI